jgi:hypothetical protein
VRAVDVQREEKGLSDVEEEFVVERAEGMGRKKRRMMKTRMLQRKVRWRKQRERPVAVSMGWMGPAKEKNIQHERRCLGGKAEGVIVRVGQ